MIQITVTWEGTFKTPDEHDDMIRWIIGTLDNADYETAHSGWPASIDPDAFTIGNIDEIPD